VNPTAILHWAALTHSGSRKPRNDDAVIAFASGPSGAEPLPEKGSCTLSHQDFIFAISDGMGGGNAGDIASSTLLQQMAEIIPQTFKAAAAGLFPDSLAHLASAIHSVHQRINETAAQSPEHSGMAATLALAWFTPENLYLANIGDSRIYLSRSGTLTQLSRDHTNAWGQWKRGEITEPEYRAHPRRAALYEIVGGGHPQIRPYLAAVPVFPGDRLLICSDGLIDGLWERNISTGLATPDAHPVEIATSLLNRAIDNSGIDDTSLIVITVSASSEATS
jgi:protein phosphatase